MKAQRKRRMFMVIFLVVGIGITIALMLNAFQQNMLFFFTPSQVAAGDAPVGRPFRIGGMVTENSLVRAPGSLLVNFDLNDTVNSVRIAYEGILPDLFSEGQGIVTKGQLGEDGVFVASEVLAKHDENYMPPEVADALKAAKSMQQIKQ